MTPTISHIWRHPIKAHGTEQLSQVALRAGQTMPWDRHWAIAHDAARVTDNEWAQCSNFSRGAKAPSLMAISADFDEGTGELTLSHPHRPELTFKPDEEEAAFLDWVAPLMPEDRAKSVRIVSADERGMTDTDFPSISLANCASNDALSHMLGLPLDQRRWRINIWVEGLAPWQEVDWVGRTLRIGETELEIAEQITRCMATTANPDTGMRDADILDALATLGHKEFGVYGTVKAGGKIAVGDAIEVV